jgi:hypothetical protein
MEYGTARAHEPIIININISAPWKHCQLLGRAWPAGAA